MGASSFQRVDSSVEELDPAAASLPGPEFELLLACCARSAADRNARIRAALRRPLAWQTLAASAEHHGLVPRLYEIMLANSALFPQTGLAVVRRLYESNLRRALWLTRELGRVLAQLDARRIPALPFKGPVLAQRLYGDVSARQYSDLDILIQADDFARAQAALLELDFRPGMKLSAREQRSYLETGYEFIFDSQNGSSPLELQWRILPRFYSVDFDVPGFFSRAGTQSLAGITFPSLASEDLLLILCAHTWKHAWFRLSWFCDIAELAECGKPDWSAVWREASALGLYRVVAVTFLMAQRLLGAPLPPGPRPDLTAQRLAEQVLPLIRRNAPFGEHLLEYFKLTASARERTRDRTRFWWRLATTPGEGEWSVVRLPGPLFPLYRIIRLGRVARWLF